jgi:hypothetical protein
MLSSGRSHFDTNNLLYYSFYPKSEKPMKAVTRHLLHNTPAEDISDGLVSLIFDVISVKQMTATRGSPSEGLKNINLPLLLIILPRTAIFQEITRLPSLCHIGIRVEALQLKMILRSAITGSSSATSGQTSSNLPAACGAGAVTCTRSAPRKGMHLPPQHAATVGGRKEENPIPPIFGIVDTRRRCRKKVAEGIQDYNRKGVLFQCHHSRRVLRGGAPRQDRGTATASDRPSGTGSFRHSRTQGACGLTPTRTADKRPVSSGT